MIMELNRQLNRSLTLNEKLNSENRVENIEALRTRLRKIEEQLVNRDSRGKSRRKSWHGNLGMKKGTGKRYAQTHQKTTEAVGEKVPYEKCDNQTALFTKKQKKMR